MKTQPLTLDLRVYWHVITEMTAAYLLLKDIPPEAAEEISHFDYCRRSINSYLISRDALGAPSIPFPDELLENVESINNIRKKYLALDRELFTGCAAPKPEPDVA